MNTLFQIPKRNGRETDSLIAKKAVAKKKAVTTRKGGNGIINRIASIKQNVDANLGQYKDKYEIITDEKVLHDYISECIKNDVIAIDTETDGLDPMLNTIAGPCIYTPNRKGAYIPMNHISYITEVKLENQLSREVVKKEFERLKESDTKVVMFNAKFDIRFIKNQVGVKLKCYWDCYLASRLLNENEPSNQLKKLHQKYVLGGEGDAFTFGDLFKGIPFTKIPVDVGYLYASRDPEITYELYEFQKQYLDKDADVRQDLKDVAWVFHNIEMPCLEVVADMEDTGMELDLEYAKELSVKYNAMLKEKEEEFYKLCKRYNKRIKEYKETHLDCKLDDPINIGSTSQLATLFYDILGYDAGVDKRTKKKIRGTGSEILKSLDKPICNAVLEYRKVSKLVTTYIDKLPTCVNPNDNRIHCSFNQYGADTGRFSSSNPNLQNIPSRNHDIRKMFKATDGYVMMSSDYS